MSECDSILISEDRCFYSQTSCSFIYSLYFCVLKEADYSWCIMLVLFMLLIYLLGTTADEYFSPALAHISNKLHISPTLAISEYSTCVTLLAFGNGAPDVFASVLAAKKLQITLSLSSLVGSSLFITTVVTAVILFISGKSKVNTTNFLRDAGTLLLTVVIIMIYGILGRIQVFQASVLLLLYVIYVVSVIYSEKDQEFISIERLDTPVSSVIFIEVPKVIVDSLNKSQMNVKELKSGKEDLSFVETIQWSFLKFQYFWEKS